MRNFWVFGYGSLMWRPGFKYLERHVGKIYGYHRALCIYSHVHRGTPEKPGLVLERVLERGCENAEKDRARFDGEVGQSAHGVDSFQRKALGAGRLS